MLQFSPGPSEYPLLSVYQNTTEFADLLDVTVDSVLPRPSGAAVLWCVWGCGVGLPTQLARPGALRTRPCLWCDVGVG